MKVIICGSRTIETYDALLEAIAQADFKITEVVCGLSKGVDALGKRWAKEHNVVAKEFPADWERYGKRAGYLRNKQMVDYADAVIAVTTGSRGTAITIELAKKKGLPTYILTYT